MRDWPEVVHRAQSTPESLYRILNNYDSETALKFFHDFPRIHVWKIAETKRREMKHFLDLSEHILWLKKISTCASFIGKLNLIQFARKHENSIRNYVNMLAAHGSPEGFEFYQLLRHLRRPLYIVVLVAMSTLMTLIPPEWSAMLNDGRHISFAWKNPCQSKSYWHFYSSQPSSYLRNFSSSDSQLKLL